MTDLLILTLFTALLVVAVTYATLKIAKIKGLRSARGLTVVLLLVLSYGLGILASNVYIPLALILPFVLQFGILAGIARVSVLKSLLVAVVYSTVVIGITWGMTMLYVASPLYTTFE